MPSFTHRHARQLRTTLLCAVLQLRAAIAREHARRRTYLLTHAALRYAPSLPQISICARHDRDVSIDAPSLVRFIHTAALRPSSSRREMPAEPPLPVFHVPPRQPATRRSRECQVTLLERR